jgi:hypothetical protein
MEEYKNVFYEEYGDVEDQWESFEECNHPLKLMKDVLTKGKKLTRIEETIKRCQKDIKGFEDELDEEGLHHLVAPMEHFTAEYWERTNTTQITFDEEVAEEMKLKSRFFLFKNRYWREAYRLSNFDYDIKYYLMIKRWFETDKPKDDEVYYSIADYMETFEDYLWYSIRFVLPNRCTVRLGTRNLDPMLGPIDVIIHYQTCLSEIKSAVSLLLMKQLMRTKENIMELERRQEVILGLVERV